MSKERPLTKKDMFVYKKKTYSNHKDLSIYKIQHIHVFKLKRVLSALALAKKKLEDYKFKCAKGCFNVDMERGKKKIFEILDECFQIEEEKQEGK